MGPREVPPPLPDLEANLIPTSRQVSVLYRPCNWMQGWEGEMDTVHAAFLHGGASKLEKTKPGTGGYYTAKNRSAKFSVIETDFGTSYGAYRPAEDDSYYWRIAHCLFPFYAMPPLGPLGENALVGMYVPMDDEHHLHWEIMIRPGAGSTLGGLDNPARNPAVERQSGAGSNGSPARPEALEGPVRPEGNRVTQGGPQPTTGRGSTLPNSSDWF